MASSWTSIWQTDYASRPTVQIFLKFNNKGRKIRDIINVNRSYGSSVANLAQCGTVAKLKCSTIF